MFHFRVKIRENRLKKVANTNKMGSILKR